MKKILRVVNPSITSYPRVANLISILEAYEPDTSPWLYDHFVQLIGCREKDLYNDFYDTATKFNITPYQICPYINNYTINRDFLNFSFETFLVFIKNAINSDYYLRLNLNMCYLCNTNEYMHTNMIYGYDDEIESFFVVDFYNNKYDNIIVRYNTLCESFFNHCIKSDDPLWMKHMILIKVIQSSYQFSKGFLKSEVTNYLECRDNLNISQHDPACNQYNLEFGLGYYNVLEDCIKMEDFDFRRFHVLYDHKKFFLKGLSF